MAVQLMPIIKAVGPYLAQVATAAIPAFTSKPEVAKTDPAVTKQIEELQAAATQNARSVQVLAEKLQETMQGIEAAAREANKQVDSYKRMLFLSLALSVVSFVTCIYLLAK